MKQIFVLICLACACLGKSDKMEKQSKEKRGISHVTISAPYSSVRYAPGFPLYNGQYSSSYHGRYFGGYGGYGGYNYGYNPYYGFGYPSYQPPYQPPIYIPQPPVIVEPQPPVIVEPEPEPPVIIQPSPPVHETPEKPVHPPMHEPPVQQPPVHQPPVHKPPVHQPPVHKPPVQQPPVYQPPVHQPPVHQPPVHQPPVHQPPVHQPPVHQPPVHEPPIHQPPVQKPPVYQPPVYQPPAQQPPVYQPPVYQPPVHQPPVNQPPVNQPPVHQPPVHQPPVHQPPVHQPPIYQPPVHQPPVHQPPVYEPPIHQPPVHQPPVYQPPVHQPPDHEPPVHQPPIHQPPVYQPPVQKPPVYQPPVHQPPVHQPPVYQPPVHQPPVYQPPVHQPPDHEPPVHQPPIHQPPVYQPPVQKPPVYQPPVHQPPIYQPPVHQPPVYQPPVHQPPVHQPPVHQPPVDHTPVRPIVPPIQHTPGWKSPQPNPSQPGNVPTVTTSHTPTEVHVTVKNIPGHTTVSHPPAKETPIPTPPPSSSPPTHLPEVPVQHHPLGPRESPQPPRIPYQPPTYIPQFDTGPQFFPPQEIYVTPAPFIPQYYPTYYPQYPTQQPGVISGGRNPDTRNIQTVSHPADDHNADLARQRASKANGFNGIAKHNNGQYLIETTQKTDNSRNFVTIQPTNRYNNRQRAQNNYVGEVTTTSRPLYNRKDGHYVTVQPQQQTTPAVSRFEVRRPAIQKQFYDVEEKVIVRPVGSAILELVDDDTENIQQVKSDDKNCTTSTNARIIGMKHNMNNSYASGINTQSNSVQLQRNNNNKNVRGDSTNRSGNPGVVYATQDMPVYFEDSSNLKTPKHILSPFAAQVKNNMTDDASTENPNSYSKAYLFGKNMINVKKDNTTPCPPSNLGDYDDFSGDSVDYSNSAGYGVNVQPKGDYGLRGNANVETTTQQNQRNYIEMLSGKNGVAEVQSENGYIESKSQNLQQGGGNNRDQGRLLSVVPVQDSTQTEAPTEHSSVRRIVVSRPVETVQIVEVPEYKQSQNQQLISRNNNNNENMKNNTQFMSSTVVTPTSTRIIYSNQKVETQTVQYQH